MTDRIASTSKEAVLVDVYTDLDPTGLGGLDVAFAFVAAPDLSAPSFDAADTWHDGAWDEPSVLQTEGAHAAQWLTIARVVIGPASDVDELEPARYRVYVRLDGADIDPIIRAGDIVIY